LQWSIREPSRQSTNKFIEYQQQEIVIEHQNSQSVGACLKKKEKTKNNLITRSRKNSTTRLNSAQVYSRRMSLKTFQ
jgi:hypothetical protein